MDPKPKSIPHQSQWKCLTCTFINLSFIHKCDICGQVRPDDHSKKHQQPKLHQKDQKKDDPTDDQKKQQKEQKEEKKQDPTLQCPKCQYQNQPTSKKCANCPYKFKKKASKAPKAQKAPKAPIVPKPHQIQQPKPEIKKGPNYCDKCQSYKKVIHKGKGFIIECKCIDQEDLIPTVKSFCNFCFESLKDGQYDTHIKECQQRSDFYDPQNKSFDRCTKLQIGVIMHMITKSQQQHFLKQTKIQKKIKTLGYTLKDLQNLYFYIVNLAPIIIHMHADKHFDFYVNDTHYRNQFETAKSSGCMNLKTRGGWEDSMFEKMYRKAEPYERVKYGTMNFTNDPHGVSVCTGYGKSYFLLKEHVRNRCTMTDHSQVIMCTFRFCYNLLVSFTDKEIHAAFEGAKAKEVKSEGIIAAYKEIQIHGPVEFKKDIERVYIHREDVSRNPKCLDQVKEFCKKNNLQYEVFGEASKIVFPQPLIGSLGVGNVGGANIFGAGNVPRVFTGVHNNIGAIGNGLNVVNGVGSTFISGGNNIFAGGRVKSANKDIKDAPIVKDEKKENKQKSQQKNNNV